MNVRDFEYITKLAKAGSISKASQELYISQPALSKFIQKMEAEAGTPLFQRIGRHLLPTYAGQQCIETATQILYLHSQMMNHLSEIAHQQKGLIRFGLPMSRSNYFISAVLPKFYKKFPHVCLNIFEDSTLILLKKVRIGELNMIYINKFAEHEDLTYRRVSEEEMVLAAPASFKLSTKATPKEPYRFPCLSPDAWQELPFLMLNEDQMSRQFADKYMKENNIIPNTLLKIRNLDRALFCVRQGLGVTICPSMPLTAQQSSQEIYYFSLCSPNGPTSRETDIVYRKDAFLSVAERELIRIIENCGTCIDQTAGMYI